MPRMSKATTQAARSRRSAKPAATTLSRRRLIQASAAVGIAAALPRAWASAGYASDEPETKDLRLGIIAVQSCAAIVAAHEKGFFKKHGINSTIAKESSWAAARDKLVSGENHVSHLKFAQPIGSTIGVLGAAKTPMVMPFTLSRNGSVFMVAANLAGKLSSDPKTWRVLADELKSKGEVLTIALPLPFGWHSLMWRHFLADGGINADKEFKLFTLPPAQMVQNLRVGTMHACAMVEPWGARGVQEKVTVVTMYGHEMWKDHPTKGLGMMEQWADANPKSVRAVLRAMHEASLWCDNFDNRRELAKLLSAPTYMNAPEGSILPPLLGEFDWGDGRKLNEPSSAITYARGNYPEPREIKWFLSQFRRWGLITGDPDYEGVVQRVGRAEFYTAALKELGVAVPAPNDDALKLWDGTVFDHTQAAAFAKSFPIHNIKD